MIKLKPVRPIPSVADWARLAAYIDGEGCIWLKLHRQFYKHLNRSYERFYAVVTVVNTDPRLAVWLKATFGGFTRHERTKNPKHRDRFIWEIICGPAAEALRGCYPYMVIKREQAEVVFAFQETVGRPGQHGHGPEVHQLRNELRQRLHDLHNTWKPCRTSDRVIEEGTVN